MTKDWAISSNTLALLTIKDEAELKKLSLKAEGKGITHSPFREPDLENSITALAIAPEGRRICKGLKLLRA